MQESIKVNIVKTKSKHLLHSFLYSRLSEKSHVLVRQTARLKLNPWQTHGLHHTRQYHNIAVSIWNLHVEGLLFYQNVSHFKSSRPIHVFQRLMESLHLFLSPLLPSSWHPQACYQSKQHSFSVRSPAPLLCSTCFNLCHATSHLYPFHIYFKLCSHPH